MKKFLSLILCLIILCVNCIPVFADVKSDITNIVATYRSLIGADNTWQIENKAKIDVMFGTATNNKGFVSGLDFINQTNPSGFSVYYEPFKKDILDETEGSSKLLKDYVCGIDNPQIDKAINWILSPKDIVNAFNAANVYTCKKLIDDYCKNNYNGGFYTYSGDISVSDTLSPFSVSKEYDFTGTNGISRATDNLRRVMFVIDGVLNKILTNVASVQKTVSTGDIYIKSDPIPYGDSAPTPAPGQIYAYFIEEPEDDNENVIAINHYYISITPLVYIDGSITSIIEQKLLDKDKYLLKAGQNININVKDEEAFYAINSGSAQLDNKFIGASSEKWAFSYNDPTNVKIVRDAISLYKTYEKDPNITNTNSLLRSQGDEILKTNAFRQENASDAIQTGDIFKCSLVDDGLKNLITKEGLEYAMLWQETQTYNDDTKNRDYCIIYGNIPLAGIRVNGINADIRNMFSSAGQVAEAQGYKKILTTNQGEVFIKTNVQIDVIEDFDGDEVIVEPSNMFYSFDSDSYYRLSDPEDNNSIVDRIDNNVINGMIRKDVSTEFNLQDSFMTSDTGHMLCLQYYPLYLNAEGKELPIGRKLYFDRGAIQYNGDSSFSLVSSNNYIAHLADPDENKKSTDSKYALTAADFGAASELGMTNDNSTNEDPDDENPIPENHNCQERGHVFTDELARVDDDTGITYKTCIICHQEIFTIG